MTTYIVSWNTRQLFTVTVPSLKAVGLACLLVAFALGGFYLAGFASRPLGWNQGAWAVVATAFWTTGLFYFGRKGQWVYARMMAALLCLVAGMAASWAVQLL